MIMVMVMITEVNADDNDGCYNDGDHARVWVHCINI